MVRRDIGGYTYYTTEADAMKAVKTSDDGVAFEGGLGWYVYSKKEYAENPRKRIFGF